MQERAVLFEKEGNIGMIKLNRPQRLNAINRQLIEGLNQALVAAKNESDVAVVILTGEGRSFCSGEDLKESAAGKDFTTWFKETEGLQDIQRNILNLGKPLIAAVRGYAVGGGCEFAMSCDIRIAAEDAKFGFPETGVGLTVTTAGTKLLTQLVGLGKAKELIFTGEFIDAQEALKYGLVNKVVPSDQLMDETMKMAKKIAERSPLAIKLSRIAIDQGMSASFEEILEIETNHCMLCVAAGSQEPYIKKKLESIEKKK
jgi:enoyl-CoA hydratase